MINLKKAAVMVAIASMLAPAAFAANYQDVVHNTHGNLAKNTFGNCVVTKWTSDKNECGEPRPDLRNLSKEFRNVYFDFNKSTLNGREKVKLDQLSTLIAQSREVENVDVIGYADKIGNSSYNQRLSMKRANTVKSYLAAKGLRTRNVRVEGMGESKPVTNCPPVREGVKASKDEIACLAEDRRVEIFLNFIR